MREATNTTASTPKATTPMIIAPVSPMANDPAVFAADLLAEGGRDGTIDVCHTRPSQYISSSAPDGSGYQPGGLGNVIVSILGVGRLIGLTEKSHPTFGQ